MWRDVAFNNLFYGCAVHHLLRFGCIFEAKFISDIRAMACSQITAIIEVPSAPAVMYGFDRDLEFVRNKSFRL